MIAPRTLREEIIAALWARDRARERALLQRAARHGETIRDLAVLIGRAPSVVVTIVGPRDDLRKRPGVLDEPLPKGWDQHA